MSQHKGGVIFDCQRINNILRSMQTEPYQRSRKKLSLFLGLGCKSMTDVILHHPHWIIHAGNVTMQRLEQSTQVREALQFEKQKTLPEMVMSIEAIPEMLTEKETDNNVLKMVFSGYTWNRAKETARRFADVSSK